MLVAHIREVMNSFIILMSKHEGKILLGQTKCGWEENIKMNLEEIESDSTNWICLARNRIPVAGCAQNTSVKDLR
jgi:hypothetical protein